MVVGEHADLKWLDGVLNEKYTARWETLMGDEESDQKETFFVNRLIRLIPNGADSNGRRLEIEADARHADILIKSFGFDDKTKGVDVPEDKMTPNDLVEREMQPALGAEQASQFRSMVMRMAYLSVDRPDLWYGHCHRR